MRQEELRLLHKGDEIDYRVVTSTPQQEVLGEKKTSLVIGVMADAALIKSDHWPDLTVAVKAKHIIAARRIIAGSCVDVYGETPEGKRP
jgi:hypothetical protein